MTSRTATLTSQEVQLSNKKTYIYDIYVSGYVVEDDENNYEDVYDLTAYISEVWVVLVNEDKDCARVDKPEIIEEIESNLDLEDILRTHSA